MKTMQKAIYDHMKLVCHKDFSIASWELQRKIDDFDVNFSIRVSAFIPPHDLED